MGKHLTQLSPSAERVKTRLKFHLRQWAWKTCHHCLWNSRNNTNLSDRSRRKLFCLQRWQYAKSRYKRHIFFKLIKHKVLKNVKDFKGIYYCVCHYYYELYKCVSMMISQRSLIVETFPHPTQRNVIGCRMCQSYMLLGDYWLFKAAMVPRPSETTLSKATVFIKQQIWYICK